MRKTIVALFLIFSIVGCSDTKDCCVMPDIKLSGRFNHEIPECDNSANPEENCIEWLEFVSNSEVDILYGGGDIIERYNFTQGEGHVKLEGSETSSFKLIFLIKSATLLERIDNGDIWIKN
ncbi:hypothetical protein JQC67_01445 [Aurantibacter crassamenti]|uniref:hypothetical protein n=1 Tax=Aurantibacter crassamenti TaxID=1837375 RepID=UPI00193A08E5|nr:hypothetical protein [Aurantibacter crassamenti]MBM1104790.1 hypothetical protein [Aurantibacter crassamenti]